MYGSWSYFNALTDDDDNDSERQKVTLMAALPNPEKGSIAKGDDNYTELLHHNNSHVEVKRRVI